MSVARPRTIRLREYEPRSLSRDELSFEEGAALHRHYGSRIAVEFPSPKTGERWTLTPQGWVGQIPLTPELELLLEPKVPIGNLFRMLEYAYDLRSLEFHDDLSAMDALDDLYERLAILLAKRVLTRARRGLFRSYVAEDDRLPFVRGRLDMGHLARRPWTTDPHCHYEEHTADLDDNQILAWTLLRIARSGHIGERGRPRVGAAHRALRGSITALPFSAEQCRGRLYHRLNADYEPMHALCRFFLDQSGPSHTVGDRTMVPFLLNMSQLFESFVAAWLRQHLPPHLEAQPQVGYQVGAPQAVSFAIDIVLRDRATGAALAVIDTKYKDTATPSSADIAQVVTYAQLAGCRDAFLVYPRPLAEPFEAQVGETRVQAVAFSLAANLEESGHRCRESVLVTC